MSDRFFKISDICPGCHTAITGGAIAEAVEAAENGKRVLGLMAEVTAGDCDTVYVGDLVIDGVLSCPRCGSNCYVEISPPARRNDEE